MMNGVYMGHFYSALDTKAIEQLHLWKLCKGDSGLTFVV